MEFLEFKLQRKLRAINDELHQALKDHQMLIKKLDKNSNDLLIKEKITQLQMHIHILGQNQKAIFFDIRNRAKSAIKTNVNSISVTPRPDILQVTLVEDNTNNQPNVLKADSSLPSVLNKGSDVNEALKQARARRARALKAHALKCKKNWKLLHQELCNAAVSNAFIQESGGKTDEQKPLKITKADPVDVKVLEPAGEKITPAVDNSAEMFLLALELIPTNTLHLRKLQEPKRATRQKRSTANHSQFVYTDSWENKVLPQKKKKKKITYVKVSPELTTQDTDVKTEDRVQRSAKVTYPILTPKQQSELAKKQLMELQKRPSYYKPTKEPHLATLDGLKKQEEVLVCKVTPPSVPPSDTLCIKAIVPRKASVLHNGDAPFTIKVVEAKQRKHSAEPSDKVIPQNRPMPSLLKAMQYPSNVEKYGNKTDRTILVPVPSSDLSLKIPGLPSSLTIMRVLDRQSVCCMCRKTGTVITNGYFSTKDLVDKSSSALTSCNNCNETYHMTCNPSAAISDSYHFCPHCSIKQVTNLREPKPVDKVAYTDLDQKRKFLLLEKQRLSIEKEVLDKKALELNIALRKQNSSNRMLLNNEDLLQSKIRNLSDFISIVHAKDGATSNTKSTS